MHYAEPESKFVRNVIYSFDYLAQVMVSTTNYPVHIGQNILISDPGYYGGFVAHSGGQAIYVNNICTSFGLNNLAVCYEVNLAGWHSLDGCIGIFGQSDVSFTVADYVRNSIFYHNVYDSSWCERTEYSDAPGCGLPTNLDVDPRFVGVGTVTEVGNGYFRDATAHWETDRYKGLYVNPDMLGGTAVYYCTHNTADTVYVMGDPRDSTSPGDIYNVFDYRLREDSDLVDAGKPDEAWNDPDGTRCDIGAYGGPYSRTPLPEIPTFPPPDTPTPSVTPTLPETCTPTGTPTNTPSPTPSVLVYDLQLNRDIFHAGDLFDLERRLWNPAPVCVVEVIVLAVNGVYYFRPSWGLTLDGEYRELDTGLSELTVLYFPWPDGDFGQISGIQFYGGCVDAATGILLGNVDMVEFGWE